MTTKSDSHRTGERAVSALTAVLGLAGMEARWGFGESSSPAQAIKLWAASWQPLIWLLPSHCIYSK